MTDAESTPITGTGELITNDGDDGTYATLNNAALVTSGDRVAWAGPASRAPAHGYSAASVNYGGCPKDAERALVGACPIVGSYGGNDRKPMGRSAAPRLGHALTVLGVDHDVKVYPHAGHGFINDHDPADATPLLIFLAKISGTRYHEASARDARRRIAAFFSKHLQG